MIGISSDRGGLTLYSVVNALRFMICGWLILMIFLITIFISDAVRKSIAELIEDDAERRGDGTSLTGTFVRVRFHQVNIHVQPFKRIALLTRRNLK